MSFRIWLGQLLSYVLRLLPLSFVRWCCQPGSNLAVHRVARLGLRNRDVTISQGVGAGLRFNAGRSNPDYALGTNEPPVQQALAHYLKPGDTFYDIGANVGFFAVIGAKLVGSLGHVYAFEPVPENAAAIQRNARLNHFSHVIVLEKAVAHSTGQGELLLARHPGGHTLSMAGTPPDMNGSIVVDLVSIDDLVAQQVLTPPAVVKIDVEGAEIDVLHGMSRTIKAFKPILIYEVDDGDGNSFRRKRQELEISVRSLGYRITTLEDAYPEIGWHVGHAIAIPDEQPDFLSRATVNLAGAVNEG